MVIKVYISGISGNKEVKKRQQRVLMILDSKNVKYEVVDIAEPGNEEAKEFMQNNSKSLGATVGDANPRSPLPPQIFSEDEYCGDYEQFDLANEVDEIEKFLKMTCEDSAPIVTSSTEIKLGNGEINSKNVENENEAEAKKDETQNEKAAEEEKIATDAKEESEAKVESEANEEQQPESDSKVESVAEADSNKIENGPAEADSSPTEIEA